MVRAGCLAHPERDGRRGVAGVADAHDAGFDAADLPGVGAEQEDVARHRLDRPVFVDGADEGVVGLGDDAVVTVLGNRTAGSERRQPRTLAPAHLSVDRVVVHVRAAGAAAGLDATGNQFDDLVELGAFELGEGRRAPHEVVQVVGLPLLRAGFGDDLLGEDVERQARELDRVELACTHRGEERGAFDELVARQREQASLRRAGAAVVRPADALEERGDAARRADLAHELHRPDVDTELERRGRDECTQVAGAQPGLDPVATILRQAAVVRGDRAVAQPLTELVCEPFREPAGVHEHERGVMLTHELGDALDHVAHLLGRRDRFELSLGQLEREIEVPLVTGVDDLRDGTRADQQPRHRLDRALGCRQSDALRWLLADRLEALEREREVRAALVARDGVDLVDDDGLDGAEELAP